MALKITMGQTKLEELHEIFDLTEEQLELKKARLFPIGNTDSETSWNDPNIVDTFSFS